MNIKRIALAVLGYVVVTFPLAILWHLVLFNDQYEKSGYIEREEPIFFFGLIAILLQGAVMATMYAMFFGARSTIQRALLFVSLFGVYHWTNHVLADAAKRKIELLPTWFALETCYLVVQFLLFAAVLAIVFQTTQAAGSQFHGKCVT